MNTFSGLDMDVNPMAAIDTMPAGLDLDRLIAEKVMGWSVNGVTAYSPTGSANDASRDWCPHYSTEIAAAWEVVEKVLKLLESWNGSNDISIYAKLEDGKFFYGAAISETGSGYGCVEYGDTAPLAICREALKLVMGATQE
jgi:hypothetical protein